MRTAIDASVLWCLINHELDAPRWQRTLCNAATEGEIVVCAVAFAEIAPAYLAHDDLLEELNRLGIGYDQISSSAAFLAAQIFKAYRDTGGPRAHMIADFLIGAHAVEQTDRLAAVDRGYLRKYFPGLPVLGPL